MGKLGENLPQRSKGHINYLILNGVYINQSLLKLCCWCYTVIGDPSDSATCSDILTLTISLNLTNTAGHRITWATKFVYHWHAATADVLK